MPTLRQSLKPLRFWLITIAAVALAAAAIFDWTRPAGRQFSSQFYLRAVVAPYRRFVRPTTSRFVHCRFYPTCSEYSVQAVERFGFPKGIWLSLKRIVRCTPFVRQGTYDPVPLPAPTPPRR